MAHDDLKNIINTSLWSFGVSLMNAANVEKVRGYYSTEAKVFHELTIRYATGQETRRGTERMEHFRFDSVLFVRPGTAGINRGQCFTAGIEIKGHLNDLKYDDKIMHYLGWTDFMYIGVPHDLVEEAVKKAAMDDRIGVLDLDKIKVVKIPVRQDISIENKFKILEQVVYSQPFETNEGHVDICDDKGNGDDDADSSQPESEYVEVRKARIMKEYDGTDYMIKKRLAERNDAQFNLSNNDRLSGGASIGSDDLNTHNLDALGTAASTDARKNTDASTSVSQLSDEEKEMRAALKEAREEERQRLAEEVANKAEELPEKTRVKLSTLPDKSQAAYHVIRRKPDIKSLEIETELGVSQATAQRLISDLREAGLIERVGSRKTGGYRVTEMDAGRPSYLKRCAVCSLYQSLIGDAKSMKLADSNNISRIDTLNNVSQTDILPSEESEKYKDTVAELLEKQLDQEESQNNIS